jgi:hypothetical protein
MMARKVALPRFGFCFNLDGGIFVVNGGVAGRRFLTATEDSPKCVYNPLPGFLEIEKEADNRRYNGLPNQRAQAGVNISKNLHTIRQSN